jgi:multidrug efflux pump subunit AcrA (membrane-fusion protein)
MKRETRAVLAGGVLAIAAALPACSRDTKAAAVESIEPLAVTVATAARADVADTFEAGGVVQARTTATMMSRILAPVREIHAAPGDRVRAGQVLIVLDGRDLAANARSTRALAVSAEQAAAAADADRQAARDALALARATYARIAGLHAKRSATAQELDDATGALRTAEARVAAAAARADAAASNVEGTRAASEAADATATFARITAPFDGQVTEKMVEPGNMAAPGTPLLRVEDTRGFRLDVRVDEARIGHISPGAAVPVLLDTDVDGAPRRVSGSVTEIGRAVDSDERSFLVKIALAPDARLRSGMFGRALFQSGQRRALTVPAGALVRRGQMTSVFVVENAIAHARLVNVRGTEVLAGLSEGEVVIVAPPPAMADGRRVRLAGR